MSAPRWGHQARRLPGQAAGDDTASTYDLDVPLHGWFERQAAMTPDAEAVAFAGHRLSYARLSVVTSRLAERLRRLGVGPDSVVGACLERSSTLVVALLAILKAGGAYLPLEPSYPPDRLSFMLADSAPKVLITNRHMAGKLRLPAGTVLVDADTLIPEDDPAGPDATSAALPDGVPFSPSQLAYVMYTSGSAGQPKAVMITHHGICNQLLWMREHLGLAASDRVLLKTPFSFDVSAGELFLPLLAGACIVVARPDGHRDAGYLAKVISQERITTLHFVPSMLRVFLDTLRVPCPSVRRVICSGEALPPDLPDRFFARFDAELHNLYGPTETSVHVTHWACDRQSTSATVPIGYPVANTYLRVLGADGTPVPDGASGELCIGGEQLARGYLSRPGLTAARFIPCPDRAGERLYRTGDLVRYRAGGALEFLGRLDDQVKLHGFRVELGEIEAELIRHPDIRAAAARLYRDQLVGYVIPEHDQPPPSASLRAFLAKRLPEHMVPTVFVALPGLPLTANGKLDRAALLPPRLISGFLDDLLGLVPHQIEGEPVVGRRFPDVSLTEARTARKPPHRWPRRARGCGCRPAAS